MRTLTRDAPSSCLSSRARCHFSECREVKIFMKAFFFIRAKFGNFKLQRKMAVTLLTHNLTAPRPSLPSTSGPTPTRTHVDTLLSRVPPFLLLLLLRRCRSRSRPPYILCTVVGRINDFATLTLGPSLTSTSLFSRRRRRRLRRGTRPTTCSLTLLRFH